MSDKQGFWDSSTATYLIGVLLVAAAGYIGYQIGDGAGYSRAYEEFDDAMKQRDTVYRYFETPVPAKPETLRVLPGKPVVPVVDSVEILRRDAEIARWKMKHGTIEEAFNRMADDFEATDEWTLASADSEVILAGSLHVLSRPLYRDISYSLSAASIRLKQAWILERSMVYKTREEAWWVKPAVVVGTLASAQLWKDKQYGWAVPATAATGALVAFKWEF